MVRNRSVFLSGLKTRLDRDFAGRERSDAAAPPRWSAAPTVAEDDDWVPATSAPRAEPESDAIPDHGPSAPPERDDQALSPPQDVDTALDGEPDLPESATTPWS
jgi:hypothetical protein